MGETQAERKAGRVRETWMKRQTDRGQAIERGTGAIYVYIIYLKNIKYIYFQCWG